MRMRYKIILVAIFLFLYPAELSLAQNLTPEGFIRHLYKEYLPDLQQDKFWLDNKKKLSQYFDRNLTELLLRDTEWSEKHREIGNLDFDPIIAAQDYDEKLPTTLKVHAMNSKSPVRVKVVFSNISPTTIIYELKMTGQGWRISDIIYTKRISLVKILSQPIENQ